VPLIAFLTGFGWACAGILIAALMKSIDNFSYVTSIVITPLFLVAGTFFPISNLPHWAQVLAAFNPLYHCVQLVRDAAVFGFDLGEDALHLAVIIAFGLLVWRIAINRMERRLIH
jgi:lipooligosaccharide transport system permease protein